MTITMIISTIIPTRNVGGLENSGRHADKKADPLGGGDEFTDDGADHGEGDTGADACKDIRRYRRKDHLKGQLPSFDSHEVCKVHVFVVHLPHAGIGVKEVEKEGQQENHTDFRPETDSQPDDEKRGQGSAWDTVQRNNDRLKNFGEKPAASEPVAQGNA